MGPPRGLVAPYPRSGRANPRRGVKMIGLRYCAAAVSAEQTLEVVVVTGASAGVGRAIATAFGACGARVALLARGRAGLEGARADVEAAGGRAVAIPTDVADAAAVERAAEQAEEAFGPLDVWVNDAMATVFSP